MTKYQTNNKKHQTRHVYLRWPFFLMKQSWAT